MTSCRTVAAALAATLVLVISTSAFPTKDEEGYYYNRLQQGGQDVRNLDGIDVRRVSSPLYLLTKPVDVDNRPESKYQSSGTHLDGIGGGHLVRDEQQGLLDARHRVGILDNMHASVEGGHTLTSSHINHHDKSRHSQQDLCKHSTSRSSNCDTDVEVDRNDIESENIEVSSTIPIGDLKDYPLSKDSLSPKSFHGLIEVCYPLKVGINPFCFWIRTYENKLGKKNVYALGSGRILNERRDIHALGHGNLLGARKDLDALGGGHLLGARRDVDALGGGHLLGARKDLDDLGGGNLLFARKDLDALGGGHLLGARKDLDALGGGHLLGARRDLDALGGGHLLGAKRDLEDLKFSHPVDERRDFNT